MVSKEKYTVYTLRRIYSELFVCDGAVITKRDSKGKPEFGWIPHLYTRDRLIHWMALEKYYNKDSWLDNLSTDMSEKIPEVDIKRSRKSYFTSYITKYAITIKTSNGIKIISPSMFMSEVDAKVAVIKAKDEARRKQIESTKRSERYEFRKGPVPNIHNYKNCHRGTYYRRVKLGNVRRMGAMVEYDEYNKPKYRVKNLPVWDDRARYNDKSWKTQCKEKKQYMKHSRKHVSRAERELNWLDKLDAVEELDLLNSLDLA